MSTRINRRQLLRGAASTAIGLPVLECMLNGNGEAFAQGVAMSRRLVIFFCPTSLRPSSSNTAEGFTPTRTGFDYDFRTCLEPLSMLGLQKDVSAISGLFVPPFEAPGGYKSDYHGYSMRSTFTGMRHGFANRDTAGATSDQVVAQATAAQNRFPSLVYQIDPQRGGGSVSIEKRPTGGFASIQPQTSPTQAYRSMMTFLTPGQPDPAGDIERRLRVSSLSFARDQITALSGKLGASDKQRLELHLEGVRNLEKRLMTAASKPQGTSCRPADFPAQDPANLGTVPDQDVRADLLVDLIGLAVACQLTQAITLSGTNRVTGDGMLHDLWKNRGGLHGQVQHGGSNAELDKANRWFVSKYAKLVAKLKSITEGTGTALDNSAVVFCMEGGKAGRAADGGGDANHSTDNMVLLLAGRAGGLKAGQHVVAKDKHPAVVFNTALRALGLTQEMGEIKGHLTELL